MIKNFTEYLFEYNNRNLYFKVLELEKKYPNLITSKWNKTLNDNYLSLSLKNIEDIINKYESLVTSEFITDCANIGIYFKDVIESALYKANLYKSWILYDGETLKICPGGGDDYIAAKVLGAGIQKVAYTSKGYVLKKLEDVSSFELYISNKYPELFATYELAGNMVKQEKLITDNISDVKFYNLYSKILNVIKNEVFNNKTLGLDIHPGNVGYDKDNKLKCFDFMADYIESIISSNIHNKTLTLNSIIKPPEILFLKKKDKRIDFNTSYTVIVKNNNNTNSLNFIDPTNNILYINHTYNQINTILNKDFIIFGIGVKSLH
jgi:hypothetical protein